METEIWKDIRGFEGLYQVSDHGRVRSVDRVIYRPIKFKGKMLNLAKQGRQRKKGQHYHRVQIYKNSKRIFFQVHRLVADAFIENENPKEFIVVNHKDGNRINNLPSNLEWTSIRENCSHSQLRTRKKDSTLLGASWNKAKGKWKSSLRIGKKRIDLGYFATEKEASEAYKKALQEFGVNNRYAA